MADAGTGAGSALPEVGQKTERSEAAAMVRTIRPLESIEVSYAEAVTIRLLNLVDCEKGKGTLARRLAAIILRTQEGAASRYYHRQSMPVGLDRGQSVSSVNANLIRRLHPQRRRVWIAGTGQVLA
jgi:hypothetical protein